MGSRPDVEWHPIEWRPAHHDGHPSVEEFRALQEHIRKGFPLLTGVQEPQGYLLIQAQRRSHGKLKAA